MRGRTLNDSFIILDEAQNTSPEQMKMFLTRLGFGSRIVVTGDVTQVDLPSGTQSGLRVVQDILDGVDDVHFSRLTSHDVVRHQLVARHRGRLRAVRGRAGGPRRGSADHRQPRRAGPAAAGTGDRVSIEIANESGADVDEADLAALARHVLDEMGVHPLAELSVLLVDTPTMTELHERWMGEPGPTDVLAFPMDELRPPHQAGARTDRGPATEPEPPPGLLGDVVLCPQVAADQAGRPVTT